MVTSTQGFLAVIAVLLLNGNISESLNTTAGIVSEPVDTVILRLTHLLCQTPNDDASLLAVLDNEINGSSRLKAAWHEATQIFYAREDDLVTRCEKIPEEYHIAVIAYTLSKTPANDTAFYSDFNTRTRELKTAGDIAAYPFKAYFKVLTRAIDALSQNPKFQIKKSVYYRGASLPFALSDGQHIAFQQFTSTSVSLEQAENYSRNVTLFKFPGPLPRSMYAKHHSGFPAEEEILVSPFVEYRVERTESLPRYIRHTVRPIVQPIPIQKSLYIGVWLPTLGSPSDC